MTKKELLEKMSDLEDVYNQIGEILEIEEEEEIDDDSEDDDSEDDESDD